MTVTVRVEPGPLSELVSLLGELSGPQLVAGRGQDGGEGRKSSLLYLVFRLGNENYI